MNSAFYQKILKENVWHSCPEAWTHLSPAAGKRFAVHFLTAPKQKCLEWPSQKKPHLMPLKVTFLCTSGPFPVQFSGNPFHSPQSWVSLMMRAEPHATTGWPNRSSQHQSLKISPLNRSMFVFVLTFTVFCTESPPTTVALSNQGCALTSWVTQTHPIYCPNPILISSNHLKFFDSHHVKLNIVFTLIQL